MHPLLYTVGHGTASQSEFQQRLQRAEVSCLIDVRIAPGSRKFPYFGREHLEEWLPAAGISYRWEKRLGGFRKLPQDSPDIALRNESFRAYAAYMRSTEFLTALRQVIDAAASERTVIMCSETLWWRCHRRLIADHCVLLDGIGINHLMPAGAQAPHRPTEGVRVLGRALVYDVVVPDAVSG